MASGELWVLAQDLDVETHVRCIATNNAGVWCAGSGDVTGNVFRSINNGADWVLAQGLGAHSRVYTMDTDDTGIWCAGTGLIAGEVWRSADNGATWALVQQLGILTDVLAMATDGAGTWCAGASGAAAVADVYRSVANGAAPWNWVQALGVETDVLSMATDGTGVWCAGTTPTGQVYRSVNDGAAWALTQQLGAQTHALSMATDGAGVWCAGTTGVGGATVYRSADNGATWALTQLLGAETHVYSIATDKAGIWIAGTAPGGEIFISTDNGATWALIQQLGAETDILAMATNGHEIWCAGTNPSEEVYRSTTIAYLKGVAMAAQSEIFRSNMAGLWVQPDGPNTETHFLGCYDVGDITDPQGEVTQAVCPDPANPGKWVVRSRSKGVADRPSFAITHYLGPVSDWLEKSKDCPMNAYLHQNRCGRVDDFFNYERAITMPVSMVSSITETNLMMRTAIDASEQSFEFSSDWLQRLYPLALTRRTTTEDQILYDVTFCNSLVCAPGACGSAKALCTDGVAVGNHAAAAPGDIWVTRDGGLAWAAAAVQPYGNTNALVSVACVGYSPDVVRIFVTRDTLAATPANVAYSDDWGASWTTVAAGATNTEFAVGGGALFALDAHNIWLCTDTGAGAAGNVYFSDDAGLTWTLQATGGDALNYIRFIDKDFGLVVGDTDEILYTTDGGTTWQAPDTLGAAAGNDILSCDILDEKRWWIGYEVGGLWYTDDGGATWTERTLTLPTPMDPAVAAVYQDIMFVDDLNGVLVMGWATAGPTAQSSVYRTMDGGLSWEIYDCPAAFAAGIGLQAIWACEPNHAVTVGGLTGATATIYDLS